MRKFQLRLFIAIVTAVAIALGSTPERAKSDSFTYSSVRRQIKVGIVVSHALDLTDPGDGHALGSENPDPHVFYILESRTDLKPLGLEYVNPHAPPVVTGDIYARWQRRQKSTASPDPAFVNGTPESRVFTVGAKVTKNMGAYWEANIDTLTAEDLQGYDLLYITSHKQNLAFGSELQQKLRHFIDGGGALWIENCGTMTFSPTSPFLLDIGMNSAYSGSGYGAVAASPNHPLLSYPFVLSTQEIQNLGDKRYGNNYLFDASNASSPSPAPNVLAPVIWNTRGTGPASPNVPGPTWRPLTVAGQIGAGKLIVSMQDCGCKINDYVGGPNCGYGGNSCAVTGENLMSATPEDMKFAYNLSTWCATNMTGFQNVRRNGFSNEKIGAVVVDKWNFPGPAVTNKVGGAVYYKNCVFAVDGNLVLHCYDAKPGEDLDDDGNPDEGIPDLIAGAPYDEIWRFPLKSISASITGASTPTIIEFYDPEYINQHGAITAGLANFNQRELVVITLNSGIVVALRAFPRLAANKMPFAPNTIEEWRCSGYATTYPISTTPYGTVTYDSAQDWPIPGPAWSEGVLFVGVNTSNGGRVIAIDPRSGRSAINPGPNGYGGDIFSLCAVPDVASAALQPAIIGTPSVAYIKDNASGAVDRVVYAFTDRVSGGGANVAQSIRAFWFGTKGEPLIRLNPTTFASRADKPWFVYDPANAGNGNPLLRQRIWLTFHDPNGTYFSQEFTYDPAPGPASPAMGYYKLQLNNTQMRVLLNPQQNTPMGMVQTDDERNTFYADYTLDWVVNAAKPYKITARSVFTAPDVQNGGSQLGGSPAVSPEDISYYTVKSYRASPLGNGPNQAAGVLFAVNEQFLRTSLRWAFTMHDGFSMTVNGVQTQIPPRLRELEATTPRTLKTGDGEFIRNVQFFGTPAYKDGVVYAVARGFNGDGGGKPISIVCAFRANPQLVLRLPAPVDPGTQLRIRQVNLVNSQTVGNPLTTRQAPVYVELTPAQYTIDYAAGLIRITSSAPPGTVNSFVSTSMPFVVQVGNGPEQLIFGTQTDTIPVAVPTTQTRMVGPPGVDNLLWYATMPAFGFKFNNILGLTLGYISSSPTIQGDNIWFGFQSGHIASLPIDPSKRDPSYQGNGSQVAIDGTGSTPNMALIFPLSNNQNAPSIPAVINPPAANANMLFVNTFNGLRVLEDTFTVIADNKRLVEVNAGGEAVWSSDGTRTYGVQGGALPQYVFDPGTGNVIIGNSNAATGAATSRNIQYSHPTVARRIGINDLLVVDTGNNRVVQIDRGGNVVWEVSRLFDNYRGVLRPGDPTTLNEPTDVQFWTDFDPNLAISSNVGGVTYGYNGPAYIVHYLISDTGNFRVIELVDVYDLQGQPVVPSNGGNPAPFAMLRQVNFVSSSYGLQGSRYRYRSVQRLVMRNIDLKDPSNPTNATLQNLYDPALANNAVRLLTLSAISNARLAGVGGVAQNLDDPTSAGQVFPAGGSGGSLVIMNEAGNPGVIVSNLRIPINAVAFRTQPIVNPTWFSAFTELGAGSKLVTKYLLADDNGCYQMTPGIDMMTGQVVMNVEWLITTDDYYRITGKRLRPASIRRLVSAVTAQNAPGLGLHHFLITNSFSGEDNPSVFGVPYNVTANPAAGNIAGPSEFHGEVVELDPAQFNILVPGHGYVSDYSASGNFLIKNTSASIVWRSPTESLPAANSQIGFIRRFVGDSTRATSTSLLEQPKYSDRPY